jgi:hypothetical protein
MNAARATFQNGVAVSAPPLDGAAIDADHLGQLPHAQGRCAVPQDRDQHHDRGNVDLGAEEVGDGGVVRDRQPPTAQQKQKRRSCSRPRRQGRPRGLRQ